MGGGTTWQLGPATLVAVGWFAGVNDVLLVVGPEPDMRWRAFCESVAQLCAQLGVVQVMHLGAYPAATPHTRPVTVTRARNRVHQVVEVDATDVRGYTGPVNATTVLQSQLAEHDIPAVGLWAEVPHYIATNPHPPAALALVERVVDALGVTVDTTELRAAAQLHLEQVAEAVSEHEDAASMVRALEEMIDAGETDNDTLASSLVTRYAVQDAVTATVSQAVELLGGMAFVAVNTSGNGPVWVAVPARTLVAGVKVTPVGSVPVTATRPGVPAPGPPGAGGGDGAPPRLDRVAGLESRDTAVALAQQRIGVVEVKLPALGRERQDRLAAAQFGVERHEDAPGLVRVGVGEHADGVRQVDAFGERAGGFVTVGRVRCGPVDEDEREAVRRVRRAGRLLPGVLRPRVRVERAVPVEMVGPEVQQRRRVRVHRRIGARLFLTLLQHRVRRGGGFGGRRSGTRRAEHGEQRADERERPDPARFPVLLLQDDLRRQQDHARAEQQQRHRVEAERERRQRDVGDERGEKGQADREREPTRRAERQHTHDHAYRQRRPEHRQRAQQQQLQGVTQHGGVDGHGSSLARWAC